MKGSAVVFLVFAVVIGFLMGAYVIRSSYENHSGIFANQPDNYILMIKDTASGNYNFYSDVITNLDCIDQLLRFECIKHNLNNSEDSLNTRVQFKKEIITKDGLKKKLQKNGIDTIHLPEDTLIIDSNQIND